MKKLSIAGSVISALLLLGISSQAQAFLFSFGFGGGSWCHPYYSGWGCPGYWGSHHYRGYGYRRYYARFHRRLPYYAGIHRPFPIYSYPLIGTDPVVTAPKVVENWFSHDHRATARINKFPDFGRKAPSGTDQIQMPICRTPIVGILCFKRGATARHYQHPV